MEKGPIRHSSLPDGFLLRAELVYHAIAEAGLHERARFLADFQRELDPWQELLLWEWIAVAYLHHFRIRPGSETERKSWLTSLLLVSMGAAAPPGDLTRALELEEARKALQDAAGPGRSLLEDGVDARALGQTSHTLAETLRNQVERATRQCWHSLDRVLADENWNPEEVDARLHELDHIVDMLEVERDALREQLEPRFEELRPLIQQQRQLLEEKRRQELLRQSSLGDLFGQEN